MIYIESASPSTRSQAADTLASYESAFMFRSTLTFTVSRISSNRSKLGWIKYPGIIYLHNACDDCHGLWGPILAFGSYVLLSWCMLNEVETQVCTLGVRLELSLCCIVCNESVYVLGHVKIYIEQDFVPVVLIARHLYREQRDGPAWGGQDDTLDGGPVHDDATQEPVVPRD